MMQIAITRPQVAGGATLVRVLASAVALALGFAVAAAIAGLGPLEGLRGDAPSPRSQTLRALPFDAPVPGGDPTFAGTGVQMPYRLEWASPMPPAQALAELEATVAKRPKWAITLSRPVDDTQELTLVRSTAEGLMTHFARLTVTPAPGGSLITFEFIAMADMAPE